MWETVIGLETHVELSTKSKIFCGCSTAFGGAPNSHCCPVCMGQPGTLPAMNMKVVEYAAIAGMALNCEVNRISRMDRKHYFYPDSPKAYQISELDEPICEHGWVELSSGKRIRITRIHMEEDAGKLVHQGGMMLIDFNRCGVPLVEIVTEPDFRSKEEVVEYLEKLQLILRACEVSDCRMQEGSMRCDVNISLRETGTDAYGVRAEIKNLNSFSSVATTIEYEYDRQSYALETGETLIPDTRHFNADTGETVSMRDKEDANDYRYFRDPDICSVVITDEQLVQWRAKLPEMPDDKLNRYISELSVPEADAKLIVKYHKVAQYFEDACKDIQNPKTVATFIVTQMFSQITTENERENWTPPVTAEQLSELIKLLENEKINRNLAKRIFGQMLDEGKPATVFLTEADMSGMSKNDLERLCREAIDENAKAVDDYRSGKEKAIKQILGSVMKKSAGRANALDAEKELIDMIM